MASIIVEFFDYQLYDLKVTVGSVLLNTPADLIKEIIIVDDGSTLDHLIKVCVCTRMTSIESNHVGFVYAIILLKQH